MNTLGRFLQLSILVFLVGSPHPMLAQDVESECPSFLGDDDIDAYLSRARSTLSEARFTAAEVHFRRLPGLLRCLDRPMEDQTLAVLLALNGITLAGLDQPDASLYLNAAFATFPALQWDSDAMPLADFGEQYRTFEAAQNRHSDDSRKAYVVLERGGVDHQVWVDGKAQPEGPGVRYLTPGLHLVQFQVDEGGYYGRLVSFVPGANPPVLAPRRRLTSTTTLAATPAAVWFPSPKLSVSGVDSGLVVSAHRNWGPVLLGLRASGLPLRGAGPEASDQLNNVDDPLRRWAWRSTLDVGASTHPAAGGPILTLAASGGIVRLAYVSQLIPESPATFERSAGIETGRYYLVPAAGPSATLVGGIELSTPRAHVQLRGEVGTCWLQTRPDHSSSQRIVSPMAGGEIGAAWTF